MCMPEILENNKKAVSKLKSKLQPITLVDHLWLLNFGDQSNVLVIKLLCAEDFG